MGVCHIVEVDFGAGRHLYDVKPDNVGLVGKVWALPIFTILMDTNYPADDPCRVNLVRARLGNDQNINLSILPPPFPVKDQQMV